MLTGAWPTMVTPFRDDKSVDCEAVDALVEWYIENGVSGIFALCQSSEMFFLSPEEGRALSRRVIRRVAGRVPVVVSGHIADDIKTQREHAARLADEGPAAVVLITNRLASPDEGEDIWLTRFAELLAGLPNIDLGVYECPYPHPKLVSPAMMRMIASDPRFTFFKDTCCALEPVKEKIAIAKGTRLSILNANGAFLRDTLLAGADGYCGVMGNIHPRLYAHLCANYASESDEMSRLTDFLIVSSAIESRFYPVCAKYYLSLCSLPVGLTTRSKDPSGFTPSFAAEMRGLYRMSREWERALGYA